MARPASKYPLFDVPFFCRFPYLLPCLVALVVAIVGLVCESFSYKHKYCILTGQNINGCALLRNLIDGQHLRLPVLLEIVFVCQCLYKLISNSN